MRKLFVAAALAAAVGLPAAASAQTTGQKSPSTVVLVHGAFAESSSWNGVITALSKRGVPAIAAANPLRGVASDAGSVSAVVKSIPGPVVLVGHSYGGAVITEAANGNANVMALVFVNGFAPDAGESALALADKFPGSTLGTTLRPVPLPGGGTDLYIQKEKFHAQFAADLPAAQASLMAATQRPVTHAALAEPTSAPSWKRLPSYVIYGSADLCIPAAVSKFMAERAKARKVVAIDGASHALMASHPDQVASLIEEAASTQ
jgi:pimeloyl-ACP methyl ester carboxylesterase